MSTQARRQKRARVDSDDEFESSIQAGPSTQRNRNGDAGGETDWNEEELQRKVKDVIRYALANEYKRKLIRRDEIIKLVSTSGKKGDYNTVMRLAREKLNSVFGMDIGELPTTKERLNQSQTQMKKKSGGAGEGSTQRNGESSTQAAAATQLQDRLGTSGTYILRYNMKEEYRTPEIISQSLEEYAQTGILYVILGLIFLNQQSMTSPDLYGHLNRLKLTDVQVRDKYLESFIKNGYLKKTKKPETSGDDMEYDFTWGPRAKVEVPSQNLVNYMLSFYNESAEQRKLTEAKMYLQGGYTVVMPNQQTNNSDDTPSS